MATSPPRGEPGAASDWLRGHAASASRTCAVAPRRRLGGRGAPRVPGRASLDWGGTRVPGRHARAPRRGQWRSQRPLCGAGPSPPPGPAPAAIVAGASGLSVPAAGNDVPDARAGGLRGGEHAVNALWGRGGGVLGPRGARRPARKGRQGQHLCGAGPKQAALATVAVAEGSELETVDRQVLGFFSGPGLRGFLRHPGPRCVRKELSPLEAHKGFRSHQLLLFPSPSSWSPLPFMKS